MNNIEQVVDQTDKKKNVLRKVYAAPRLIQFGSAAMLTLGAAGSGVDIAGTENCDSDGSNAKTCFN